jgi:TonB-linked SusC/RagA family outer membrane protein
MKRPLLIKMLILSCFALLFRTIQAGSNAEFIETDPEHRQIQEVTGTVTSAVDGIPLPGVNVYVKGTTKGTITDTEGNFKITADSPEDILVFSFIGYQNEEVVIGNQTVINIVLTEETEALEEVVVIGYGTVRKKDLTGSVSTVSAKEITALPVTSPGEALKGRSAGVYVIQGDAQPGESPMIIIRGRNSINTSNSPLWIVDGYPYEGQVNPEDIASISILKDASSTAIYGSRGSNGVILVTTKKGLAERNRIQFSSSFGVYEIRKKLPMLNTAQYMDLQKESGAAPISDSLLNTLPDYYWQDEVYRTGYRQEYNLGYSGGNENTLVYLSANYQKYEGIVKNSYFERFQTRMNVDKTINKNIRFGNNLAVFYVRKNGTLRNTSGREKEPSVSHSALAFPPRYEIKDADGNYVYRSSIGVTHPVAAATERIDKTREIGVNENAFAEIRFLKDFTARLSVGATLKQDLNQKFWPKTVTSNISDLPQAEQATEQSSGIYSISQLSYQKTLGDKHNISATAFYQYEFNRDDQVSAGVYEIATDVLLYNELEGGEGFYAASGAGQDVLKSVGSRLNYVFGEKYYFTFTFRRDGCSKFSENNKWANFPAVAVAWDISKEKFVQNIAIINQLKFRNSYGLSGNQAIGRYQTFETYRSSQRVGYLFNNVFQPGITGDWAANPNLKWETSRQFDAGIDLSAFESRVNLVIDYYHKINENLLMIRELPATSFFTRMRVNAGEVQNYGFESSLNVHAVQKRDFQWSITANYSFNRNKILKLDEEQEIYEGGISGTIDETTHILREGFPLGLFYGYETDGIFKDDEEASAYISQSSVIPNEGGQFRIVDVNEDGKIDVNDRTFIGNPEPDFIYGLNSDINFRNFSFNIFIQGSYGNELYNYYRPVFYVPGKNINKHTDLLNRWTPENTETSVPKVGAETSKSLSAYVEDGSYLRVRNISLSYRLPEKLLNRLKIQSFTISASLQNWFTITSYSGYDPEVSYRGNDNILQGIDWAGYPATRNMTFGIKLEL